VTDTFLDEFGAER